MQTKLLIVAKHEVPPQAKKLKPNLSQANNNTNNNANKRTPPLCKFFAKTGRCNFGDQCRFAHVRPTCKFFAQGACKNGNACAFSHDAPPMSGTATASALTPMTTGTANAQIDLEIDSMKMKLREHSLINHTLKPQFVCSTRYRLLFVDRTLFCCFAFYFENVFGANFFVGCFFKKNKQNLTM